MSIGRGEEDDDYRVYDKSVKHYAVTGDISAHISCVAGTIYSKIQEILYSYIIQYTVQHTQHKSHL